VHNTTVLFKRTTFLEKDFGFSTKSRQWDELTILHFEYKFNRNIGWGRIRAE